MDRTPTASSRLRSHAGEGLTWTFRATRAQVRVRDLDRDFAGRRSAGFLYGDFGTLQQLAVQGRKLARHAVMTEAVWAVSGDLEVENPIVARRGHGFDAQPQTLEVVLELVRLGGN